MAVIGLCYCVTLWHISIGTGVIRSISFLKINHAPHAKTGAQDHNEGLQSVDVRRKELHNIPRPARAACGGLCACRGKRRFSVCRPPPCTCNWGAASNRTSWNRTGAGPGAARYTCRRAWWQVRWGSSAPGPAAGYFGCNFPTAPVSGHPSAWRSWPCPASFRIFP